MSASESAPKIYWARAQISTHFCAQNLAIFKKIDVYNSNILLHVFYISSILVLLSLKRQPEIEEMHNFFLKTIRKVLKMSAELSGVHYLLSASASKFSERTKALLNAHIVERFKMCAFSWSKHGRLQSPQALNQKISRWKYFTQCQSFLLYNVVCNIKCKDGWLTIFNKMKWKGVNGLSLS